LERRHEGRRHRLFAAIIGLVFARMTSDFEIFVQEKQVCSVGGRAIGKKSENPVFRDEQG
jgi:hypothetical protein